MSNYKIEDIFRISSTRPNALRVCNKKIGRNLSEIVIGDNTGSIYFLRPNKRDNTIEVITFYLIIISYQVLFI